MFFRVARSVLFTVFARVNLADIPLSAGMPAADRTSAAWDSLRPATLCNKLFLVSDSEVELAEGFAAG